MGEEGTPEGAASLACRAAACGDGALPEGELEPGEDPAPAWLSCLCDISSG